MRLAEVVTPPTKISVTSRFNAGYDKFEEANPDVIPGKFKRFCKAKLEGVAASKDDMQFSPKASLAGFWHYHLIKGKAIIIYKRVGDTVRLYDLTDHSYTSKSWQASFVNWAIKLDDSDFTDLDLNSLFTTVSVKQLTPSQKSKLEVVIFELVSSNAFEVIKPALERNDWTNLMEWYAMEIPELTDTEIFTAFGGADRFKEFIRQTIKHFGKTKEYLNSD